MEGSENRCGEGEEKWGEWERVWGEVKGGVGSELSCGGGVRKHRYRITKE